MEHLKVIVRPGRSRTEIKSEGPGIMRIDVHAPAKDGRANQELVRFLSRHFRKRVEIRSGFASREKLVRILP